MDRRALVCARYPTLHDSPILERKEPDLMPKNNLPEVRAIFPHTIAVYSIIHPKAAFDLIKWCMDNFQHDWTNHFVDGIVYIQIEQDEDLTLFLLYWAQDTRIEYTILDIVSELGV